MKTSTVLRDILLAMICFLLAILIVVDMTRRMTMNCHATGPETAQCE